MELIQDIRKHFNENRWFTQGELPGVNYHTLYALVHTRGMLECKKRHVGKSVVEYYRMTDDALSGSKK